MGNAPKGNLNYGNAYNNKWQSQPNYSWGNNQYQIQQQQKMLTSNFEETLKKTLPNQEQMPAEIKTY